MRAESGLGDSSIRAFATPPLASPYSIFDFQRVGSSAVDPRTGYLYVANNEESDSEIGRITIYDPARSSVVGFIHDVTGPMVFDPTHGELVVLHGTGATFVNTTTNHVVATISGLAPGGWRHPVLALDPVDGLVYAAQNFQSSGTIWLGSTIEVLSLRLHSAVAHIDGLWWTEGMTYNPRDGNLYVANVIGRMTVFDPRTNALVATLSGLDGPNQIAYNPADGNLYIASNNGRYVNQSGSWRLVCTAALAIVDPRTLQVIGNITGFHPLCHGPDYVVYDPDDGRLYVANATAIVAVDPKTRALGWEVSGLSYPGPLTYDPANHHIYAGDGDGILDLDPSARRVSSIGHDYASPSTVAYDSTRNRIYAANQASTSVIVIDGATNRIVGRLGGFKSPDSVTYDLATDQLFVGNERNSSLSVVDLKTNRMVRTIPGVLPWAVLYDSRTDRLFVSTDAGMSVISGPTNSVVANLTAYGSLTPMAVDPVHGRLFALTHPIPFSPGPFHLMAFDTGNLKLIWDANVTKLGILSLAFDAQNGNLYAGLWGSAGIAVIDSTTGSVLTRIPGPSMPVSVLFNPANGYLYAADSPGYGILWVIDGSTNRVVGKVVLPVEPNRMVYDEANQEIYVAASLSLIGGVVVAVPSLQYPGETSVLSVAAPGVGASVFVTVVVLFWLRIRVRRRGDGGSR
jgi:YVTN family beta-propeller protein